MKNSDLLGRWQSLVDLDWETRLVTDPRFFLKAQKYAIVAFSPWEKIFQDPTVTTAAVDRVVHHSVILKLGLPSYRLEAAK